MFSWGCKSEAVETPKKEPAIEEPAKVKEQPTVEVDVRDPRIPSLAYRLRRTVRGEINYHWGLDQDGTVFYAQIHQESGWNPDARSVYASGLAQFTPDTADWISKLYPVDLGENNPLDCRWAIRALVKYDFWLYQRAFYAAEDGSRWRFTLSGYNGGEGNVKKDRVLAEANGKRSDTWICNVEHHSSRSMSNFKENRDYVKKILDRWIPLYKKGGFV